MCMIVLVAGPLPPQPEPDVKPTPPGIVFGILQLISLYNRRIFLYLLTTRIDINLEATRWYKTLLSSDMSTNF